MDGKDDGAAVVAAGEADEVARLREALEFERMKNQVLVEQLIGLEDQIAAADAEEFSDVIPEQDQEYWAGQLVTNREAARGFLERLRNRIALAVAAPAASPDAAPAAAPVAAAAPAVVPAAAPAAAPVVPAAAPAFVPPKPLHNRAAAKPAVAEADPVRGGDAAARYARVANRSRELVRSHGISFDAAWRRAEHEMG